MAAVAKQLDLLSEASQIRLSEEFEGESDSLPPYLQESFFTLVAIGSTGGNFSKLPELGQAGKELSLICENLNAGQGFTNPEVLTRVKEVCVRLVEHLNDQRPAMVVR